MYMSNCLRLICSWRLRRVWTLVGVVVLLLFLMLGWNGAPVRRNVHVAVCFWGMMRSVDTTLPSIKENIFGALDGLPFCSFDVFVHTYTLSHPYYNFHSREAKDVWDNNAWRALRPLEAQLEDLDKVRSSINFSVYKVHADPWNTEFVGVENLVLALHSLKQVTLLWEASVRKYDFVIYCRPDVRYLGPLKVEFFPDVDELSAPDFHEYQYVNDRFAIARPKIANLYGTRYDRASNFAIQNSFHSEAFLFQTLASFGVRIKRIPFRFRRVRVNGREEFVDRILDPVRRLRNTDTTKPISETRKFNITVNFFGERSVNGLGVSSSGFVKLLKACCKAVHVYVWNEVGASHLSHVNLNVFHMNYQELQVMVPALLRTMKRAELNVNVPYWEVGVIPAQWVSIARLFDEIWAPTQFIQHMFSSRKIPARVLSPPLLDGFVPQSGQRKPADNDDFIFLYAFDANSGVSRKNPLAFVEAFVEEFGGSTKAVCVLKAHNGLWNNHTQMLKIRELMKVHNNVIMICEGIDNMPALFRQVDVYVSTHRSEGLGLTLVEAMASGKPVIATGYGGISRDIPKSAAIFLRFKMVRIGPGNEPYAPVARWASPSPGSIRRALRLLFTDQKLRERVAHNGQQWAIDNFSFTTTRARLVVAIETLLRGRRKRIPGLG